MYYLFFEFKICNLTEKWSACISRCIDYLLKVHLFVCFPGTKFTGALSRFNANSWPKSTLRTCFYHQWQKNVCFANFCKTTHPNTRLTSNKTKKKMLKDYILLQTDKRFFPPFIRQNFLHSGKFC